MIKLLFELLEFLRAAAPLLISLAVFTLLSILLAKSIKRRAAVYYTMFCIPFLLVAIPTIAKWLGMEMFSLNRVPILGEILRDYIHMGTFGHPLLIIIMYMGALDPKIPAVKKLMSIRKELSIIAGFPILTHSLIRVSHNFPNALKFFTDNEEYMANARTGVSELGAGISSFSFVLGVVMLAIFLPLWITSFKSVHKRMGNAKWKKLQKWSYVLYATLFIHAMGIQVGGMLSHNGGNAPKPATETVASGAGTAGAARDAKAGNARAAGAQGDADRPERAEQQAKEDSSRQQQQTAKPENGNPNAQTVRPEGGNSKNSQRVRPAGGGRIPTKGFADINVSSQTKRYISIASLLLIYGSYLFLRLRKARKNKAKK